MPQNVPADAAAAEWPSTSSSGGGGAGDAGANGRGGGDGQDGGYSGQQAHAAADLRFSSAVHCDLRWGPAKHASHCAITVHVPCLLTADPSSQTPPPAGSSGDSHSAEAILLAAGRALDSLPVAVANAVKEARCACSCSILCLAASYVCYQQAVGHVCICKCCCCLGNAPRWRSAAVLTLHLETALHSCLNPALNILTCSYRSQPRLCSATWRSSKISSSGSGSNLEVRHVQQVQQPCRQKYRLNRLLTNLPG